MIAARSRILIITIFMVSGVLLLPQRAAAHCDTMEGPVVTAAKLALKTGDVTPVLKWVHAADEAQVRIAFERTLKVRTLSPEAREMADHYFFETLVRIHRAGEGAPYTGLKSEPVEPAIAATDEALETGSVESLVKMVTEDVSNGIRQRFAHAAEAKKHVGDSVTAGRDYVAAYVELTHYVEGLHEAAAGAALHRGPTHVAANDAH